MKLTKKTLVGFISFKGEKYLHLGPPPSGDCEPFKVYLKLTDKVDKSLREMLDLDYVLEKEVIDLEQNIKHQWFISTKLVRGYPSQFATIANI